MITQKNFWFFFGGTWFGIGILFFAIGAGVLWHEWSLGQRIARDGATVQGVVLAKSMRTRKDQEPAFRIEYRYAAGGAVTEATADVDDKTWDSLTEGGAIAVAYVRSEPAAHRLLGQPHSSKWFLVSMFMGIGGLLAISGAVILWRAMTQRGLAERLGREGARVTAEVVEVRPTLVRVNRQPQWQIHYRYRDPLGRTHDGRSAPMTEEEASRWKPGDRGVVRYLRNHPQTSAWVGKD